MSPPPATTCVLLVEDNPGDADLFRQSLSKAAPGRFAIHTVSLLSEAAERVHAGDVDVVVLDLALPDSFGIETLRVMRRAAPLIPIVVLTGEDDERLGLEALTAGAQDYLVKGDGEGRSFARALLFAIERRHSQEQVEKLEGALVLAGRMSSVGTLASGIAHEINNPLAYVISNLELVVEELGAMKASTPAWPLHAMSEAVAHALQGAQRVSRIVKDLQTFSRADLDETRRPLALHAALELAIRLALDESTHRARLVREYGPVPLVCADDARLSQVFVNLLVNASQAIPEGSGDDHEIRVVTRTDSEGRAVIEIRDTGVGIPERHRAQVFDPFFTTRPVGGGAGLGLSIVHGIVADYGGEVTFETPLSGRGTVFRVVLPPAPTRVEAPASIRPVVAAAGGRRGRVLVIDDEPLLTGVLQRILADHDVVTARNGREAMERLDGGERFDVILCDLMMPVMSGMGLFEHLSKTTPELAEKLVFVTGGAFTPTVKAFLDRFPRQRRVDKPFQTAGIRALVRSLVDGAGTGT